MFKLDDRQCSVVVAALRAASEMYMHDALLTAGGEHGRIAEQFQRQSDEALALADMIEAEC